MESGLYDVISIFKQFNVQYNDMNIHQKINLRSYIRWLIDNSSGVKDIVSEHVWRGGRFLEIEEPKR